MSTIDASSSGHSIATFEARYLPEWLAILDGSDLVQLVEASRDRNGFKREAALHLLIRSGNPAALPIFVERLNDWVPQIRRIATQAVEGLLRSEHAAEWINALPMVLQLREQRRVDHSSITARALELILHPAQVELLLSAVEATHIGVARAATRLCIDHALVDPTALIDRLMRQPDVVARDQAAGLLRRLEGEPFEAAAVRMIGDSHMSVRREALQQLLLRSPAVGLTHARDALFDSGAWIRGISLRAMKTHGIDTLPILLSALAPTVSVRRQRAALHGLADAHGAHAIEHLLPYIEHPQPSLRRSALQALACCTADMARPRLLLGLCDESPAVVAACSRMLRTASPTPSLAELFEAMQNARCERTFDACLSLSRATNKWDRLILLLTLRQQALAEGREVRAVDDAMSEWTRNFNRNQVICSPAQRARIEPLLSDSALGSSQGFVALVRFSL